jgi:hypothetical protein
MVEPEVANESRGEKWAVCRIGAVLSVSTDCPGDAIRAVGIAKRSCYKWNETISAANLTYFYDAFHDYGKPRQFQTQDTI